MIDLSIVIVSFNTKGILKDCLQSISGFLKDSSKEIIVIDNNSIDGTLDLIRSEFKGVKIIENKENLGFGKANNQGMKQAKGEFILLLNSDTVASKEALDKCLDYLKSDSNVGVLGCRLRKPDGCLEDSCGMFYSLWNAVFGGMELNSILDKLRIIRLRFPRYLLSACDLQQTQEVNWVAGAFMFLRRDVFKQTLGFDEKIFMYDEELEWCYRIKKKGWKVVYFPLAEIVHIGRGSSNSNSETEINKRILSGKEYYFKKHFGETKAFIFKVLIFLSGIIKLPIWFIIYIFSGFKVVSKTRMRFQISSIMWFFQKDTVKKGRL